MPLTLGAKVRIKTLGERWTDTARENLPGIKGRITDIKEAGTLYPYRPGPEQRTYLVEWGHPVSVNPISTFTQAWLRDEELEVCNG